MNIEPQLLKPADRSYPETMRSIFGALAAPDIWYLGNPSLLNTNGVGFAARGAQLNLASA